MKKNVLIFPSGSEGALDIFRALRYNLHFRLVGFSGKENYTDFLFPEGQYYYGDERLYIGHPDFEEHFLSLLQQYQIDFIIPTFDAVALKLMQMQPKMRAKVVCSPEETIRIANNKKQTYEALKNSGIVPKTYETADQVDEYPVFAKPQEGMGSQGVRLIQNEAEFSRVKAGPEQMVICEYLPGREYTVDCFTDRTGKLCFVGCRERTRIWHGISFRAELVEDERAKGIAEILNRSFSFRGGWFFQVKEDRNGELKLLEFSARLATNSSFFGKIGVNIPLLSLFDAMDLPVKAIPNETGLLQERCLRAAYRLSCEYDAVYIDFDDTLVVDRQVNTQLMAFVYQCINRGVKVFLLTRHYQDLDESMKRHRISKDLFDEIIWLKDESPKAACIKEEKAIFIDNYFVERQDVQQKLGIPVFDVDAVDALLDERRI